jgi:hypothetical protein
MRKATQEELGMALHPNWIVWAGADQDCARLVLGFLLHNSGVWYALEGHEIPGFTPLESYQLLAAAAHDLDNRQQSWQFLQDGDGPVYGRCIILGQPVLVNESTLADLVAGASTPISQLLKDLQYSRPQA